MSPGPVGDYHYGKLSQFHSQGWPPELANQRKETLKAGWLLKTSTLFDKKCGLSPKKKTRLLKRRFPFCIGFTWLYHMKLLGSPSSSCGEIRGLRGLWANWGLSFDLGFAEDGENVVPPVEVET